MEACRSEEDASLAKRVWKGFWATAFCQEWLDVISVMIFLSTGFLRAWRTCFSVSVNLRAGHLCVSRARQVMGG